MQPELREAWKHIRALGLGALAHATRHAAYAPIENHRWPDLAALQAAHAAELLIKARIAQEHPLLIFDKLPDANFHVGQDLDPLTLRGLFEEGRTVQWSQLPQRLWATTGISLPELERFKSFGRLRNGIQHFGPPIEVDVSDETLRFIYGVIDPFINESWGLYAVDFDEDSEPYIYVIPALIERRIPFLVSPYSAKCFDQWDVNWRDVGDDKRREYCELAREALGVRDSGM